MSKTQNKPTMASSIFTKLSRQSRQREDAAEGEVAAPRPILTLGGLQAMGLTLRVTQAKARQSVVFPLAALVEALGEDCPVAKARFTHIESGVQASDISPTSDAPTVGPERFFAPQRID